MSVKITQNILKKNNRLVFVATLWKIFIIPTFYMHKDNLWCVDSYILPRMQQSQTIAQEIGR